MKVDITSARVHVTMRFTREGSVLAQTVRAGADGIETRLEVESPEEPARVAGVVRNAENGCYVMQSLANPTPVATSVALNGAELSLASYPPPSQVP